VAGSPQEATAAGRTVEEAVAAAAARLGIRPDEAAVEVLEEGGRGWLGLGNREARVRVCRPSKGDAARRFIQGLAQVWGSSVDVEAQAPAGVDDPWSVTVATEDAGRWIGHRGQTLDALRVICDSAATRISGSRERLVLDVGGYRERREHALQEMAVRAAERARRLGRDVALEPMSPADRRIVHLAVRDVPGVSSESIGEEPHRRVVITPAR
jgi:spoIIIJ-associated protein